MQTIAMILGILFLSALVADLILTTIGAVARPVISHRIGGWTFRAVRALARGYASDAIPFLVGPAVMVAVAGFWVLGFSVAWTLIYAGGDPAISMEGGGPPGAMDIWSHVGHLLSTLGGATTQPASGGWNAVGVLVGVNGMVALTLAVSFTLSTTNTVNAARAFARRVFLDAEDGALRPGDHERDLSEIVSAMAASPFAAYYSHPSETSRFTAATRTLLSVAEGRDLERLQSLLGNLPDLEADGSMAPDRFRQRFDTWCKARTLPTRR